MSRWGRLQLCRFKRVVSQTIDFNMYLDQELTQGSLLSRDSTAHFASRGVRPQQQL